MNNPPIVPFLCCFVLEVFLSNVMILTYGDNSSTTLSSFHTNKTLNMVQINNATQLRKQNFQDRLAESSSQHQRKHKIGRHYAGRSRNYKRERHRHSTRVQAIKPATILLPPVETYRKIKYQNGNNRQQNLRKKSLTTRNSTKIADIKSSDDANLFSNFIMPPALFLLPPYEDTNDFSLTVHDLNWQTSTEAYTTQNYYSNTSGMYTSTENVGLTLSVLPVTEPFTNSINYSEQYLNSTTESNVENVSVSVISNIQDNYFISTITPIQDIVLNENGNDFNLLANDVASLGMKVTTSEKGLEMIKQFHNVENSNMIVENSFPHNQFSLISNLATAETGDYWRNFRSEPFSEEPITQSYQLIRNSNKICKDKLGYVADISSGCQIFYICIDYGVGEPMLCPNGTLFNQDFLVCDWWYNVECIS